MLRKNRLLDTFSKAFDNVSPSIKLREIGFSKSAHVVLVVSVSQCAFSKLTTSASRGINIGVPQGSNLRRLLFCYIYMNDLRLHLHDNTLFYDYYMRVSYRHRSKNHRIRSKTAFIFYLMQLMQCQLGLNLTYSRLMPKKLKLLSLEHHTRLGS